MRSVTANGQHLMVQSARSQSVGCGSILSNPDRDCKSRAPKSATGNVDIHWQEQPEPFKMLTPFYFPPQRADLLGARFTTMANMGPRQNSAGQSPAANGLAIVRVTIGAMLVWVFFENLGKGLYTPAGYAGLINYYIKASHSPAAWKAVMGFAASHAAMAAPMQAVTEIGLGILLVIGLLTRPAAFVAFLYLGSLWVSEWGTSWIWELLVSVLASLALVVGRAGRAWGVDAWLAQRWPSSPWW
jgi:uncharacterized membrane protein YphA (DoxX/SURF4 family)